MSAPGRFAGIVLAAGDSRRMGRPKAALDLDGRTFAAAALESLARGGADPLVVVAGRHAEAVLAALPATPAALLLVSPDPDRGQLSSLKLALSWLLAHDAAAAGAVVALVDHPAVRATTVAALIAAAGATGAGACTIAIPRHGGRRGHPVAFARAVWDELLATPDDAGARAVTRRDPGRVAVVDVDDAGVLADVDTPLDYERLTRGAGAAPTSPPPPRGRGDGDR